MLAALGQEVPLHEHYDPLAEGPVAYVAQSSIHVGEIREGSVAQAKFTVENRGTEDLVILDVRATCGCTTVELTEEEKTIAPAQSQTIEVIFDSTGRVGLQRKPVVLTTNDPRNVRIPLTLVAQVRTLFEILPTGLIHLRSVQRGDELGPYDVLPTDKGAALEELKIDVSPSLLEVRREPITDEVGGTGVRLFFTVPDEIELGIVNGRVLLTGRVGDETATLPMRVTGTVVGDLVARPMVLQSLSTTPRGHRFSPVSIVSTNDKPFHILSVEASEHLEVTFKPRRERLEYEVQTLLRDTAPDGPLASNIRIRTDNSGQPILEVPLFVQVRPRCSIEPSVVLLGPSENARVRKVRLQASDVTHLELRDATSDHPQVAVEVLDQDVAAMPTVRHIRIGLVRNAVAADDLRATVTLRTNIPGAEEIKIPVEYTASSAAPEKGTAS